MKRLLIINLFILCACKPNGALVYYDFGRAVDGITVTNDADNKRLAIELINKKFITIGYLSINSKTLPLNSEHINFSDSGEEEIVLDDSRTYDFKNVLQNRTVYINYSLEIDKKINSTNGQLEMMVNGVRYWKRNSYN